MDVCEIHDVLMKYEASCISLVQKGFTPPFPVHGNGVELTCASHRKFLDFTSSFGTNALGHCHGSVVSAIVEQAHMLGHTMTGIFPHAAYANCVRAIASTVGRSPDPQVLLTVTGSEAVEAALKLCYLSTGKRHLISFRKSFHGQTLGTLQVTGQPPLANPFSEITPQTPYQFRFPSALDDTDQICRLEDQIRGVIKNQSRDISGIIVEPMLNAGGYVVPPDSFLPMLRQVADDFGILLVIDEVFTGFGRCGHLLLADTFGVRPDILLVGKSMSGGLPIAACVADRSVMNALRGDYVIPLHGTTFFGSPIICAGAFATIETITSTATLEHVRTLGARLRDRLQEAVNITSAPCYVRGRGLAQAVAVKQEHTNQTNSALPWRLAQKLQDLGVIALASGLPEFDCVSFCPPFVVTAEQIDHCGMIVEEALRSVLGEGYV